MKKTILILTLALFGCALPPQIDQSADAKDSKKRDMWNSADGEPYQQITKWQIKDYAACDAAKYRFPKF